MMNEEQQNYPQVNNRSLNSHSAVFIWFLTLYPLIGTALAYNYALKDAGYAAVILYPMAAGGLLCSFIINLALTIVSKDKEQPGEMYLFPKITPILSGVFLFLVLFR